MKKARMYFPIIEVGEVVAHTAGRDGFSKWQMTVHRPLTVRIENKDIALSIQATTDTLHQILALECGDKIACVQKKTILGSIYYEVEYDLTKYPVISKE